MSGLVYKNPKARAFKFAADYLVRAPATELDDAARLQLATVVIPSLIGRALKAEESCLAKPAAKARTLPVRRLPTVSTRPPAPVPVGEKTLEELLAEI
jgi:hypothetical protein